MEQPKTKICSKCKKIKDITLFFRHNRAKDGYQFHCKSCCKRPDANEGFAANYKRAAIREIFNVK